MAGCCDSANKRHIHKPTTRRDTVLPVSFQVCALPRPVYQNQHQHGSQSGNVEDKKRVPGYPQDDMMMMPMDEAVAKPENYGLAPGWSASLQGMMNLIRVLPPEKYEEVMKRVREGRTEKPSAPAHKHD